MDVDVEFYVCGLDPMFAVTCFKVDFWVNVPLGLSRNIAWQSIRNNIVEINFWKQEVGGFLTQQMACNEAPHTTPTRQKQRDEDVYW